MLLNDTDKKAMEVCDVIRKVFNDKSLTIEIFDVDDDNLNPQFKVRFLAYRYYYVVFQYERDIIGCSIQQGEMQIPLTEGQHCYSSENLEEYFSSIINELKLRIPDKYLIKHGWM